VALGARPAHAYDFEITSRTEAYGYQLRRYARETLELINRRRITQLLGLRVFNLLDPGQAPFSPRGDRPPALLTFHALMRFETDFGSYADGAANVPEIERSQIDLLLAALEGRNLFGFLDFTLGRQLDFELLDFFAYDGLRVRINTPWHLYVESYFGVQVAGAHPLSSAVFETDGATDDPARGAWSPSFGVAVGAELPWLHARVAYRGVAAKAAPLTEPGASPASVWGVGQEALFVGAMLEVPRVRLRPQLGLRYSFLTGELDDLQLGLGAPIGKRVEVQVEYLRSRPHFDGDSIFNIFSLEPFSDLVGRATVQVLEPLALSLRVGYRWAWTDPVEGETAEPGSLTLGLVGTWKTERLRASLEGYYFGGRLGSTGGADLDGTWTLLRWLSLSGRLSLVRFHDAVHEGAPVTSFGFQAGTTLHPLRGVRIHVLLEDNVSRLYASALRLLGVLDLELAP